jgi:tRNA(fMet)-specific endonuclease VapC
VSSIVVDTNILSYELKRDTRAVLYASHLQNKTLAISFVTLAELLLWANRRNWGKRRLIELDALLSRYFVINSNDVICHIWAKVTLACERKGHQIAENDAWIAACAIHYNAPLVTHNWRDFADIPDLEVITEHA